MCWLFSVLGTTAMQREERPRFVCLSFGKPVLGYFQSAEMRLFREGSVPYDGGRCNVLAAGKTHASGVLGVLRAAEGRTQS